MKCLFQMKIKKMFNWKKSIKKSFNEKTNWYNYDDEEYLKIFKFNAQNFFNVFIPQNSRKIKKMNIFK